MPARIQFDVMPSGSGTAGLPARLFLVAASAALPGRRSRGTVLPASVSFRSGGAQTPDAANGGAATLRCPARHDPTA
nr:MAG TPA: hypothetical protein [Caudoviricetes sp.]